MYRLGLIGYPLGHSLSPTIQQAALQAMCLPGEYRLYPIEPLPQGQSALVRLIERMRRGELDGLNVTIPHKPSVVPLLDELTPTAAGIRAVNTIYRDGSRLFGDNTDAPGFLTNLERLEITRPGRALVLGAGGSARSVVYALAKRGWQVQIAARQLAQAQALAEDVMQVDSSGAPPTATNLSYAGILTGLPVDLIVNTTPVGMSPLLEANPWPAGLPLPEGAFVYDLIYNPAETQLLSAARQAGLNTANGLETLVEQAALSLQCWTGQPVPRQAMWQSLEEFISGSQIEGQARENS